MGYMDPDPYYNPDEFDLTQVAFIERDDLMWEFSMLVVWQHEDGRLFWASDAGCSCPSPFEDFNSLDSLNSLNPNVPDQMRALEDEAYAIVLDYGTTRNDADPRTSRRVKDFMRDVRDAAATTERTAR